MSHGHNQAEEAEHASHHATDPFNRRVALTMMVIAALLAAVKVQAHRVHNDTLRLQIQTGIKHTQADVAHTQESDLWNFFQAQKIRQHMYETQAEMLELSNEGKESELAAKKLVAMRDRAAKYKAEAEKIKKDAEAKKAEAEQFNKVAGELQNDSEDMHHRADYFDWGEMGIEIALVVCSLAILVRGALFWYLGMGIALVGVGVACLGLLPVKHEEHKSKEHGRLSLPALVGQAFEPAWVGEAGRSRDCRICER